MKAPVEVTITVHTGGAPYAARHVSIPRADDEPSLVTRDNVERAAVDALSEAMDEVI